MKVALIGNPNSGKTTLFNALTGLRQNVGNFPGVTVERKTGKLRYKGADDIKIIDLPGTYSLTPRSIDEEIAAHVISDKNDPDHPDMVVVVLDATRARVGLYLAMQVMEQDMPTVVVLNMADELADSGEVIDLQELAKGLGTEVFLISAKKGDGMEALKERLAQGVAETPNIQWTVDPQNSIERHVYIKELMDRCSTEREKDLQSWTRKVDNFVTHPVYGLLLFAVILISIFQAIFSWAEIPMDWIDVGFASVGEFLGNSLPAGFLTDLLIDGIWAGLGGIIIFIPQIAFLFFFIALMEESGYMARVSFITDGLMRKMGLNGRSVVPLISGLACAVPAIMATRTIPDRKERLITILVTPFMSCAARLPVYAVIIALVIPSERLFGFINYQGLTMTGMYLIGVVASLGVAWMLSRSLPKQPEGAFMLELPMYRRPSGRNVLRKVLTKVGQFVFNAGKIIMVISILLWLGASFGPGNAFEEVEQTYTTAVDAGEISEDEANKAIASEKLERSYIGIVGKGLEPIIEPLGYDWKIGIALVTSFAAREVFVGTVSTIYSLGDEENTGTLVERLEQERRPDGSPMFTLAMGISLLLFYAFAMQCMSTVAIVKAETQSWKYAFLQMLGMTLMAYLAALFAYQLIS